MSLSSIYESFTEENFEKLKEVKADRSWRRAIIEEFGIEEGESDD